MPTLLSLFDGSGGFPLAGALCGITPKYASEVEPYPIAVTRSRFPDMIHLGDVSKVHGWDIDPVDVVTFGSPCQDMSIAGKRAGIKNENVGDDETTRSGLFHDAARIIREMRETTNGVYPRFAVWENVPGAFSSNKGEDFRCVLETLIQIVEPCASMPPVPKGGWPYADCYVGDGWSVAYRTVDAQYWGVPQRRRRIYLVLDLTGQRAGEILFKRPGLRGYFETSGTPGQGTASDAPGGAGTGDRPIGCDLYSGNFTGNVFCPLTACMSKGATNTDPTVCIPINDKATRWKGRRGELNDGSGNGFGIGSDGDPSPTRTAGDRHAVCVPVILDDQAGRQITVREDGVSPTLRAEMHGHPPCVVQSAAFKAGQGEKARGIGWQEEKCPTLIATNSGTQLAPTAVIKKQYRFENHSVKKHEKVICIQGAVIGRSDTAGPMGPGYRMDGKAYTLDTKAPSVICMATQQSGAEACENCSPCLNCNHEQPIVFDKEVYNSGSGATGGHYISEGDPATSLRTEHPPGVCICYIVRRLTPTECCRLQGFPDGWGEIDQKDVMDPEEDFFWLEVRQTFDRINGRAVKDYTPQQILAWYNKLHTDSAEYKMWGNGIALPNALYVMQGIAEALQNETLPHITPRGARYDENV